MEILPTAKTPAITDIAAQTILLYGLRKIGKTTLCSQTDNPIFLATEPGLNSLEAFQIPIPDWETMLAACAELSAGNHKFKTVVIDTIDNAYKLCSEYICKKHGMVHESDQGFGKGFALTNNEFRRVITKLGLLPYGLFLVSHAQTREITPRAGNKYDKIIPTLPEKAAQIILGMADMILYCDIEMIPATEDTPAIARRVIRTKPTVYYEAGDRTGRLPDTIDLSYSAFLAAYKAGLARQGAATSTSTGKTTTTPAATTAPTPTPVGETQGASK